MTPDLNEMLGRIDERTRNIDSKLDTHITAFNTHLVNDQESFEKMAIKQGGTDVKMAFYAGGLAILVIVLKALKVL